MKKLSAALFVSIVVSIPSQLVEAAPSINEMQTCQGLLDYLYEKTQSTNLIYAPSDKEIIAKGLQQYDDFIQETFITPGLQSFVESTDTQVSTLQAQIDDYKVSLVEQLRLQYAEEKFVMNEVVSLNNCTKKAVPSGNALGDLKQAMERMIALVKQPS
ncbi:hypothetical protein [Alteromonas oceanisediminis]|uniref:hypothetical protein n=1 Tax=Alteromonas oceanisediminis TaxID=2836180 RepID=UPI001BD96BD7|nr:hypothetical protein [Alteromonas oceanisediminis]MBT0586999.1 hypothetical protein [Alteromonas oceanisediminis]